jgi:hypothetical protein
VTRAALRDRQLSDWAFRRRLATVFAAAAELVFASPSPTTASINSAVAGTPYCGTILGFLGQTGNVIGAAHWFTVPPDGSAVHNVRAGQHDCHDRLVIDVLG